MPMMKKDELMAQATRLGIEFPDGITYAEKNSMVRQALEKERLEAPSKDEEIARLRAEVSQLRRKAEPETRQQPSPRDEKAIPKGRVILAPEMKPTKYQLLKYEEEVGKDTAVEEVSFRDTLGKQQLERDVNTGTFRVKGKGNRRVIAQSTLPLENAGVSYDPEKDLVPVVTWRGKRGYVWTHQHYPNVKELLMACGKYHDYEELFDSQVHPENIWYAAGKMLVCSISVVHRVFAEIEGEASREGK